MRLFVAVNLPAEVRRSVASCTEGLRQAAPSLAWVRTELLHVTIKFLGEQPESSLSKLHAALAAAAKRVPSREVTLEGTGTFPNLARPRVVWLGMTEGGVLARLVGELDRELAPLGFAPETRAFRPHVTLARVKHALSGKERGSLANAMAQTDCEAAMRLASVDLMRSELGPAGARYTLLESAELGA